MNEPCQTHVSDTASQIENWAASHVRAQAFPLYSTRWYRAAELGRCYCLGAGDPFPCPHCQDLSDQHERLGHEALVAEWVGWRRRLLRAVADLDVAATASAYYRLCAERGLAAYHIYALEQGDLMVTTFSGEYLVQDKSTACNARNARLAAAPVYKPAPGGAPIPNGSSASHASVFAAYKAYVENALPLKVTGMARDQDVLLVKGGLLDDIVAVPHDAGYSVHEQALVVKITAKALLDYKRRRDEQIKMANELMDELLARSEPHDWMAPMYAAPGPASMCHEFGYSGEPEPYKRYKRPGKRR